MKVVEGRLQVIQNTVFDSENLIQTGSGLERWSMVAYK